MALSKDDINVVSVPRLYFLIDPYHIPLRKIVIFTLQISN